MRNRNIITALVAGALALAATNLRGADEASHSKSTSSSGYQNETGKTAQPNGAFSGASDLKASSIIGLEVRNETGQRLGAVQDLIVRLPSRSVPFAIVEYGGALGIGETRVAVPLTDLKWSSEPRELILTATKEQFESATTTPTGGWMAFTGEDWLKGVDRFYGQPSMTRQSRYERQEANGMGQGREPVRNPSLQKGATDLQTNLPPYNK